jgi:hypothetical protein
VPLGCCGEKEGKKGKEVLLIYKTISGLKKIRTMNVYFKVFC